METLGEFSGRFNCEGFRREPLWKIQEREDDDGNVVEVREPNYYGQTRALAAHLGGQVADMAGGFVAVALPTLSDDAPAWAAYEFIAYDVDDMSNPLITWWETAEGENRDESSAERPLVLFGLDD